ncbi:hypothetical protein NST94_05460 [Paenibacillus sp. FSL H8-0282]|uniref:hypothetical protein n=1 Tax=Paenibacillus sp. FSL H8-0282 TaxID=2954741 RepID=UPI0030D8B5E7
MNRLWAVEADLQLCLSRLWAVEAGLQLCLSRLCAGGSWSSAFHTRFGRTLPKSMG